MADDQTNRILGYLRSQREDMVELLERLALAESPSDDPAALRSVIAILSSELEKSGLFVRRLPRSCFGGDVVRPTCSATKDRPVADARGALRYSLADRHRGKAAGTRRG